MVNQKTNTKYFEVGIIGAGIAGSSLAILLAQNGYKVVIFDRDNFPRHKVCGEFVSNESWPFFNKLGLNLQEKNLPNINKLKLTSQKGFILKTDLTKGGFGISRFMLDNLLVARMKELGVEVHTGTKVSQLNKSEIVFNDRTYNCDLVVGAFGKYRPSFNGPKPKKAKHNFLGVKYHIRPNNNFDLPVNEVALHSFKGGYCGTSMVENGIHCLCYLIDSEQLKSNSNVITKMEEEVLYRNEALSNIFKNSTFLFNQPLVVSNVQFDKQDIYSENKDLLVIGDAAGSISPLSGNGMSMAAQTANVLFQIIENQGLSATKISPHLEEYWSRTLGKRVSTAKYLNTIMLNPTLNHLTLQLLSKSAYLRKNIVDSMQGEEF